MYTILVDVTMAFCLAKSVSSQDLKPTLSHHSSSSQILRLLSNIGASSWTRTGKELISFSEIAVMFRLQKARSSSPAFATIPSGERSARRCPFHGLCMDDLAVLFLRESTRPASIDSPLFSHPRRKLSVKV